MAAASSVAPSAVSSPSPSDNEELELKATEGRKYNKKNLVMPSYACSSKSMRQGRVYGIFSRKPTTRGK